MREKHANHSCNKFIIRSARNDHHLSYDDGLPEEPFLLSLIKDVIWYLLNFNLILNCISLMKYCLYLYELKLFFLYLKTSRIHL